MKCAVNILAGLVCGMLCSIAAQDAVPHTEEPSELTLETTETTPDVEGPDILDDIIKMQCDKNGASVAFESVKNATHIFRQCLESNFDGRSFRNELSEAQLSGDTGKVFSKYRSRFTNIKNCITEFNSIVAVCLNEVERVNFRTSQEMTTILFDFLVDNNAASITRFVETGGMECLVTAAALSNCTRNYELESHTNAFQDMITVLPWPQMVDSEDCKSYSEVQTCVVSALQTCGDGTPSNIVETLLNDIKRVTPCGNQPTVHEPKNNGE